MQLEHNLGHFIVTLLMFMQLPCIFQSVFKWSPCVSFISASQLFFHLYRVGLKLLVSRWQIKILTNFKCNIMKIISLNEINDCFFFCHLHLLHSFILQRFDLYIFTISRQFNYDFCYRPNVALSFYLFSRMYPCIKPFRGKRDWKRESEWERERNRDKILSKMHICK